MAGAEGFIGYYVSLQCDNDSTYEGEVSCIDPDRQLITLTHAHQMLPDGNTMKFPQITLTGNHVMNLKIIRQKLNLSDPPSLVQKVNEMSINSSSSSSSTSRKKQNNSPKEMIIVHVEKVDVLMKIFLKSQCFQILILKRIMHVLTNRLFMKRCCKILNQCQIQAQCMIQK